MTEVTSYFSIAVAVFILLADLLAIISVFRSEKPVGLKSVWAVGLIIFPVIGLIVWGIAGHEVSRRGLAHRNTAKVSFSPLIVGAKGF